MRAALVGVSVAGLALFGCSAANTTHSNDLATSGQDLSIGDASTAGDSGAGQLVITPPALAFGSANCGGASPSPQPVTLANTGTATFSFVASLDNAQFFFATLPPGDSVDAAGNLNGTIAAGATQTLSLGSFGVPYSAVAGADINGNLTVTVVDSQGSALPLSVPLSVTPFGVTIVVTPVPPVGSSVNYNFGAVPEGTLQATNALELANLGNDSVGVSLGFASDPEYSATVPGGSTLAPGQNGTPGNAVTVAAMFTANTIDPTQATVPILLDPVDAPVCGQSATIITLAGQGNSGNVSTSTTTLSWTPNCGTAGGGSGLGIKTVMLANAAASPQPITLSLASATSGPASGFALNIVGPAQIGANGTLSVHVSPPPAPKSNGITAITDTLLIQYVDSTGNSDTIPVALAVNPVGAIIDLQLVGGAAPPLSFGVVPLSKSATASFQIVNVGNLPLTAATVVGSLTGLSTGTISAPGTPLTVPANNVLSPLTVTGTYAAPASLPSAAPTKNETGQFAITDTTDVICNTIVPLSTTALVTTGLVIATPQTVVFSGPPTGPTGPAPIPGANLSAPAAGTVYCNTQAAAQVVQLSNYDTVNATITGYTFLNGTATSAHYTVTVTPASGVIVPGTRKAQLTITPTIAPSALPPNPDLGDTLTITVMGASGIDTFPIQLVQQVGGAVLTGLLPAPIGAPPTSTLAFGSTPAGTQSQISLGLQNQGNLDAHVAFAPIPSPINYFSFAANPVTIAAKSGAPANFQALFQPAISAAPATLTASSQLQLSNTPLCGAISSGTAVAFPVALAMSGTITKATKYSVTPNPISFTQPCGAVAGKAATVTITSSVKGTFDWSAVVTGVTGSPPPGAFALTPASGTVTNGTQATFTVTPATIASALSVGAPVYQATLQVTVEGIVFNLAINETPSGVIIASTPASLNMAAPGQRTFLLYNNGTFTPGVTFTAVLGTGVGATFQLFGPGPGNSYTVTSSQLTGSASPATDTVTVTAADNGSDARLAICNAGGMLTIPVTATPATNGSTGGGGGPPR